MQCQSLKKKKITIIYTTWFKRIKNTLKKPNNFFNNHKNTLTYTIFQSKVIKAVLQFAQAKIMKYIP